MIVAGAWLLTGANAWAVDIVHNDDTIIEGNACIGVSCVKGEVFGPETIKLKDDVVRIKAEDTSSTAGFPSNDWQITFNDSGEFGQNFFAIDDLTGNKTPFTLEAGAPSHSLYVDDSGRVGLGTSTPAVDLHIASLSDPRLRLEKTGGSPGSWDISVTSSTVFFQDRNTSLTPFKIFEGATTNSLVIGSNSNVGLGTALPAAPLHLKASAGGATPRMLFENPDVTDIANQKWFFDIKDNTGDFRISRLGSGVQELNLTPSGNIKIPGNYISGGTTLNVPDYVFEPGYPLLPLDELSDFIEREKHLPNVPSAKEIHKDGIHMTAFQMKLLEKVEELTLYVVAQEQAILKQEQTSRELKDYVVKQEQAIRELKERLEGIESAKN